MALLFPMAPDKLMPEALPSDEALARLTPLELTSALHACGISDALAALHRLGAPALQAARPGGLRGLDVIAGQADAVSMLRRLLGRANWDADALRDIVCDDVVEALGDPQAILVIDETGILK